MKRSTLLFGLVALALGGCNQTASSPAATPAEMTVAGATAPGATPDGSPVSAGGACRPDIERFQAVLKTDLDGGRLTRAVYGRASSDVRQAENACEAGRDVQARTILVSAKRTYGYP